MANPTEELAFLRKIISDSRRSAVENGLPYIVWGVVVTIGVGSIYVEALLADETRYSLWVWAVMLAIGITFSVIDGRKERNRPVRTFADQLMGMLWTGAGSTMFLIGFAGTSSGSIAPLTISPLMACVLGIAYFVSGFVYDLKWVRNLAFGWWAGAIAMFYWHSVHTLGLYCLLMIFLQTIPGIILYRKYKAEHTELNHAIA